MATETKRGLGKGFEALIPTDFDTSIIAGEEERVQKLLITHIKPNPQQPRRHFDETALNELADSIKRHGLLQPVVVTPTDDKNYTLIAGERRWRAANKAGLTHVAAIVRTAKELEQLEIALVENVQRVDLSPLEQAASIGRLHEQFNLDYADIAKKLGKAPSTVQNIARLLGLSDEAKQALHEGKITEGHARAILAVRDNSAQAELLQLILKNSWSVRQAERYAVAYKKGIKKSDAAQKRVSATTPETEALAKTLNAPVKIQRMAKGGRLEITFTSDANLKSIIRRLLQK
jgi:ParB family chromosome partitioning protein